MSEELMVVPELVSLNVNVDKDDVAAILLARAETLIKNNISTFQAKGKKLRATGQELQKELAEKFQEAADAAAEKTKKTLMQAAEELGCKHIEYKTGNGVHDDTTFKWHMIVLGRKPDINWAVNAESKLTAAVKATLKSIQANNAAITEAENECLQWRRKLQDLPSLERRARAAVAEARLTKTTAGQEILSLLEGKLEGGIALLGIS